MEGFLGRRSKKTPRPDFYITFSISAQHSGQKGRVLSRWPCCRKGDPFQGPKVGSCLTLRNELSEETHVLTSKRFYWERAPLGGEQEGQGTQENCSSWLAISGFMVMGLVSGWSLANHSNS